MLLELEVMSAQALWEFDHGQVVERQGMEPSGM